MWDNILSNSINSTSKLTIDIDDGVITVRNATQSLVLTGTASVPAIRAEKPGVAKPANVHKEQVEAIGSPSKPGFASGKLPQRRYTTGRNQQLNIKANEATVARIHRLADAAGVPLCEILDRALFKLEESLKPDIGAVNEPS